MISEKLHDKYIAPLLLQAAETSKHDKGTILCFSEYVTEEGELASTNTMTFAAKLSARAQLVEIAILCQGNLDTFFIELKRRHKNGQLDCSQTITATLLNFDESKKS